MVGLLLVRERASVLVAALAGQGGVEGLPRHSEIPGDPGFGHPVGDAPAGGVDLVGRQFRGPVVDAAGFGQGDAFADRSPWATKL